MEVGIDSFAAAFDDSSRAVSPSDRLRQLVEQIAHADQAGLDAFGVGEHHRREFLDSAPAIILAAAAARTNRIRLTSAVTVLSAADPVRVFQNFATLDLRKDDHQEIRRRYRLRDGEQQSHCQPACAEGARHEHLGAGGPVDDRLDGRLP